MVVVAAFTVCVAVGNFFFRSGADADNADIKRQGNARQWVVGVDGNSVIVDGCNANGLVARACLGMESSARDDLLFGDTFKHAAWHLLGHALVVFTVGFSWSDGNDHAVIGLLTFQLCF